MEESINTVKLLCIGLNDLQATVRALTPQGFWVRNKRWFGRKVGKGGDFELQNPFFHTTTFKIIEFNATEVLKIKQVTIESSYYKQPYNLKVITESSKQLEI